VQTKAKNALRADPKDQQRATLDRAIASFMALSRNLIIANFNALFALRLCSAWFAHNPAPTLASAVFRCPRSGAVGFMVLLRAKLAKLLPTIGVGFGIAAAILWAAFLIWLPLHLAHLV
jgi:hypothetical protein